MSHATLKFVPGVNRNRTPALNETQLSESNLIRFVPDNQGLGLVQKLGGWKKFFTGSLSTITRTLWAWQDTNDGQHLACGGQTNFVNADTAYANGAEIIITYTAPENYFQTGAYVTLNGFQPEALNGVHRVLVSTQGYLAVDTTYTGACTTLGSVFIGTSLSVITNGSLADITPGYQFTEPYVHISTTGGSPICIIEDKEIQVKTGDSVYIKTHISVGGIVLFGAYDVTYVDATHYSIVSVDVLGNPKPATATVGGGGVLPIFDFAIGSPYVTVTLPNHGYAEGDTFPIIVPVYAGTVSLYGNYIVSLLDVNDPVNTFTITASNVATTSTLACRPLSLSSDGQNAYFHLSAPYGVDVGDKIRVQDSEPSLDGEYTVTSVGEFFFTVASTNNWNFETDTGYFYKSQGGDGKKLEIAYSSPYNANVGDTIYLSSFVPNAYNGEWKVTGAGYYSVEIDTTVTGSITSIGVLFVKDTVLNLGRPIYQYFNSAYVVPVQAGYGLGGYGVGGYGIGAIVPPTPKIEIPVTATSWSLDNWGEILIACPEGGPIFQWSPIANQATAAVISQGPLVNDGCFVAMPQRQIVAWGSSFTGIKDPLLVRWCDVNDYTTWSATVTNQAGSYRISKGSKIVGGIQGPQQALIWTDIALWSMQYIGLPYVYSFTEIGTGCGLISRRAAGSLGGAVYWMSQSQFFVLGSEGPTPLPCPIWDVIFQDMDLDNVDKIRFAANSNFNEVMWYYPTTLSSGENSRYVKYNTVLQCWDYGVLDRTAWINQSVFGPPIGAGADKFIYQHETALDADGQNMPSFFKTGYAQVGEGEFKIFLDQVWPDFKWGFDEGSTAANLNITFWVTDYPGDTPKIFGPMPFDKTTEYLTPRFRGRLVAIEINEVDGPQNTQAFWRIGALRYRAIQDGKF